MDQRTTPCTIILGGTKGLGSCIADECLARKQKIMVLGRLEMPEGQRTGSDEIEARIDLKNEESVTGAISTLAGFYEDNGFRFPRFYWVAGMLLRRRFGFQRPELMLEMIDVNLRNALLLVNYVWSLAQHSAADPCHLIVISSTTGLSDKPKGDEAIYAATKAAQVSFARALGKGYDDPRFKVSLFCPGGMQTPFWSDKPDVDTSSFLDPKKVASKIVETVETQTDPYFELAIPRGSL